MCMVGIIIYDDITKIKARVPACGPIKKFLIFLKNLLHFSKSHSIIIELTERTVQKKLNIAGWSSSVARRAHNPKVVGSNPAPATRKIKGFRFSSEAFFRKRDLFPHYCSCPQSPCLSGLRASTRLRRNPRTLFAEGTRPAPLSHPFLPVARSGKPCYRRKIPARTTGRSRHERQR